MGKKVNSFSVWQTPPHKENGKKKKVLKNMCKPFLEVINNNWTFMYELYFWGGILL